MNLLMQFKYYILIFFLGAAMTATTFTCVSRGVDTTRKAEIQRLNDEANRLRGEAQETRKDALAYQAQAKDLRAALEASTATSTKLKKELDKIKIADVPTPPTYIADVVADLNKWGLNPLVGASNVVGRSAFGIKKDETQILWSWGAQAQRVPMLEFKLAKTNALVTSITNDKDLAVKLAATKTLEAAEWQTTADRHMQEADSLRSMSVAITKSLAAEKRKKYWYAAGALVVGGLTVKALK